MAVDVEGADGTSNERRNSFGSGSSSNSTCTSVLLGCCGLRYKWGLDRNGRGGRRLSLWNEVRFVTWLLVLSLVGYLVYYDGHVFKFSTLDLTLEEFVSHDLAVGVAGCFAAAATVLSLMLIHGHMQVWVHPTSQRLVCRILGMVPVYAVSAWLSLIWLEWSLYTDFLRSCYEGLVLHSFFLLLVEYLGGHKEALRALRLHTATRWPLPLCCLPTLAPKREFLRHLQAGTLQYVIIVPICSALAIVFHHFELYGDGDPSPTRAYLWVALLLNFSQLAALYCLAWFYLLCRETLKPFGPVPKFVLVKSVVFFTWWQSFGLALAIKVGVLKGTKNYTAGEFQVGLQDFIICIEMFIAAAFHKYTFGPSTYADGTLKSLMDARHEEMIEAMSGVGADIILPDSHGAPSTTSAHLAFGWKHDGNSFGRPTPTSSPQQDGPSLAATDSESPHDKMGKSKGASSSSPAKYDQL